MRAKTNGTDGLLGDRLRSWRKSIPLKGFQLAQKIGITGPALSELEKNRTLPSAGTLAKLARNSNLNILWLLTGEGDMYREESPDEEDDSDYPELKDLYGSLKRIIKMRNDKKTEHLKGYLLGADPGK